MTHHCGEKQKKQVDQDQQPNRMRAAAENLKNDAERNRRRILEAAGEVFAERGLGVTMDDIARRFLSTPPAPKGCPCRT